MRCSDVAVAPQSPPIKILVVEDEPLIRYDIAEALRERGVRVVEAATADEAWDYLSSEGEVDLVFTDQRMPGTMTGIQLADRVRTRYPHIQVVITSGHFIADGTCEPVLSKPYSVSKTAAALAERARATRSGGNL